VLNIITRCFPLQKGNLIGEYKRL